MSASEDEELPDIELHMAAVEGLLQLGEPENALAALQSIEEAGHARSEVNGLRLRILLASQRWEDAALLARELWQGERENVEWFRAWTSAIVHSPPSDSSAKTLRDMLRSGIVDYAAALAACEAGHRFAAVNRLQLAFELNPSLRWKALEDPRLQKLLH